MGRSVKPPEGMVRVIVNVDPAVWQAYKAAAKAAGRRSASDAIRDHLEAGPPLPRGAVRPRASTTTTRAAGTARAARIDSATRRRARQRRASR